jgi:hypothetical protein
MFSNKELVKLVTLLFLTSCSAPDDFSKGHLGKLSFYDSLEQKSFTFVVSDKASSKDVKPSSENYSEMTKQEVSILKHLLKKNKYCINNKGKLLFKVTSRQKRIYDITLSSLIGQQYNARSLTPVTYFGKCL